MPSQNPHNQRTKFRFLHIWNFHLIIESNAIIKTKLDVKGKKKQNKFNINIVM